MTLSASDLNKILETGITAALKAGSLIALYADKNYSINYKTSDAENQKPQGGTSEASQVVTEVDVKSQDIILNEIESTCKKYDLALLTEESVDDKSRFEKDYFWCIDPLDGTLPFTEGVVGYSVCISLIAKDGTPLIGIIYDPKNDNLYHAIKDGGAYKNRKPMVIDSNFIERSFHLVTDRSFIRNRHFAETENQLKNKAIAAGANGYKLVKDMGAAMNAIAVIEQQNACYFKFPKPEVGGGSLWDFSASACIFNELGLVATDINNQPLPLNKSNSTFMNDCGVIFAPNETIASWIRDAYERAINSKW